MTWVDRLAIGLMYSIAAVVLAFLLAPIVVAVLVSFSSSPVFTLPAPSWTLRWYQEMAQRPGLATALLLSVRVAALATFLSLVLGTLAAIGLVRGNIPFAGTLTAYLLSPLMFPGLVIGIAMLHAYRAAGLEATFTSLVVAHVIIAFPYTVRTIVAALQQFDFTLMEAAQTLGCRPAKAVLWVLVPGLAPAFLAGGLFAFLASMDNYPVSIFFTDARTKTLPIQMLQLLDERPDPAIAAVSACLILLTVLVMVLGDRLVGLKRIASL